MSHPAPESASRTTPIWVGDSRSGWTIVIPKGWVTLPTADGARQRQIRRLLDREFAGHGRDEVARARHEISTTLDAYLARAAEQGAAHVHFQTQPMRGVPIAASLVVTMVPGIHEHSFAEQLSAMLSDSRGVVEHGPAQAGPFPALRRLRRVPGDPPEVEGHQRWETIVDYIVELSGTELLLMTFATTTDPIADAVVTLFDAIAHSLRTRDSATDRRGHKSPSSGYQQLRRLT